MFGFFKRLFGRTARPVPQPDVAPASSAAPVESVAPVAPLPVLSFEMAPFEAPVFFPPEEPQPDEMSGYDMIPSLGNPDAYMVGLVGEEHHAVAVEALRAGMTIWLQLEPDNPNDSSAIAAVDGHGRVIGYIAQESWLREAVYGAGAGFSARVLVADTGSRGFREVVIEVLPTEHPLRERRYRPLR